MIPLTTEQDVVGFRVTVIVVYEGTVATVHLSHLLLETTLDAALIIDTG